ncbi:MAG: VWA domain-containing protein [Pirellulaceae bacterium]
MFRHGKRRSLNPQKRKGIILVLVAFALVLLFGMAAFCIDLAYMQLVDTELTAATDAAAKAAARELSINKGNTFKATKEGIAAAARNKVAGKSMILEASDFQYGQSVPNADGSFGFQAGSKPYTAVRVVGRKTSNSSAGEVSLFFGPVVGFISFEPTSEATASFQKTQIVIAVDRSHSMCFDYSGVDWVYPFGVPSYDADGDGTFDKSDDALMTPPHPLLSRWAGLSAAVNKFLDILDVAIVQPEVGLVTWGSFLDKSTYEYTLTGTTVPAVIEEEKIAKNYLKIRNAIAARGSKRMLGGTNTAAGLDAALNLLDKSNFRSKKVVLLLTDGAENAGRGAINSAADAKAQGVVIHVITFLGGDQSAMAAVAELTGGRHIHASNPSELISAFEDVARLIPIALTE